ncbi:MAG TPA: 6-phosphogluconolactonase [bacterium]|nr:6-phosphogluconolactonase [bacterium]HPN35816.1 6-phosphogluconolactonase [bacterium]
MALSRAWILHTAEDAHQSAAMAARRFHELAGHQQNPARRFRVALAGGGTPKRFYQTLAESHRTAIDWSRIDFFWSDERWVPPDDPQSNYRLARECLLDPLSIPETQIFRVAAESGDADQSAAEYERTIVEQLGEPPVFDLILLGVGEDGHTASLFPGSAALKETVRWVVSNWVEKLQAWRITFTLPLLNQAKHIFFLVNGPGKADAMEAIFRGPSLPAARVRPVQGEVEWFADTAAAGRLLTGP